MESSTPRPLPSPTPLNRGPGPTAPLRAPSCDHTAPLHRHQHLHPLHHRPLGGSRMVRGHTTAVIQGCRCCPSGALPVRVLLIWMCALSHSVRKCVHAFWTCETLLMHYGLSSTSSESKLRSSAALKSHSSSQSLGRLKCLLSALFWLVADTTQRILRPRTFYIEDETDFPLKQPEM